LRLAVWDSCIAHGGLEEAGLAAVIARAGEIRGLDFVEPVLGPATGSQE